MPADTLIYSRGEPKPPFQSRNELLINKVKTCGWLNNVWIISFCDDERICRARGKKNTSAVHARKVMP